MSIIIGIDPGLSGGIAVFHDGKVTAKKMPDTYPSLWEEICEACDNGDAVSTVAYIEDVHAMTGEGVSSVETFAKNVGHIEMGLHARGIRVIKVSPQRWQSTMDFRRVQSAGPRPTTEDKTPEEYKEAMRSWRTTQARVRTERKRNLKELAQRLYPEIRVTLATADAILIMEYGRRMAGI